MERIELRNGCESSLSYDELVGSIAEIAQAGAAIQYERDQAFEGVLLQASTTIDICIKEEE